MYRIALVAIALIAASGAAADECDELGLESPELTEEFCNALRIIAEPPGATRTILPDVPGKAEPEDPSGPTGVGIVDRAYRADPRKTLELIKRIKGAGGLTETTN